MCLRLECSRKHIQHSEFMEKQSKHRDDESASGRKRERDSFMVAMTKIEMIASHITCVRLNWFLLIFATTNESVSSWFSIPLSMEIIRDPEQIWNYSVLCVIESPKVSPGLMTLNSYCMDCLNSTDINRLECSLKSFGWVLDAHHNFVYVNAFCGTSNVIY